jgi:hypothetical protein
MGQLTVFLELLIQAAVVVRRVIRLGVQVVQVVLVLLLLDIKSKYF